HAPLRLIAGVDQDRAAARAPAGLDVVENVADQPGRCEIDIELARRPLEQARRRLAALADASIALDRARRMVRAVVEAGEADPERGEPVRHRVADGGHRRLVEQAARDARLIRDDRDREAGGREPRHRALRAPREADPLDVDVVGHVLDQRAVLVEENGPARRRRRAHGHDVSLSGMTISSGITVPAGWVSTKRTAAATLAGSCSTLGSMSGKRSSRNGVRMPPAMRAVTLMWCSRPSTCSAWLSPSRPHLLA